MSYITNHEARDCYECGEALPMGKKCFVAPNGGSDMRFCNHRCYEGKPDPEHTPGGAGEENMPKTLVRRWLSVPVWHRTFLCIALGLAIGLALGQLFGE
jgi:hypothetical protein